MLSSINKTDEINPEETEKPAAEMTDLLGNGNVTITISLENMQQGTEQR